MPSGVLAAAGGRSSNPTRRAGAVNAPSDRPPDGTTGVERTIGVDWLSGTVRSDRLDDLRSIVESAFGPSSPRQGGMRFYRASEQVGSSSLIGFDGIGGASGTAMLSISGEDMTRLGWDGQVTLLASLRLGVDFRASRVDLYVDDWAQTVRPEVLRSALERGQAVTRTEGFGTLYLDPRGWQTLYIGSRASPSMLRVYEKGAPGEAGRRPQGATRDPDTGGSRPARVRYEYEAKGEQAEWLAGELMAAVATAPELFWAVVRKLVDFRDRSPGQPHGERAPMLSWWAELVGAAGKVGRAIAVALDGLAERAGWVRHALPRILASVWLAYGDGFVSSVLSDGLDRLTERDRWLVSQVAT